MGRGTQSVVRGLAKILLDTPLCGIYKIVWLVMFVIMLDCVRQMLQTPSSGLSGSTADAERVFSAHQAREGALAWALNLVTMLAVRTIHGLVGETMKLEMDRDIMKRQAEQANKFVSEVMKTEEKKAESTVAPESKMVTKDEDKDGDTRKRN
eukprot:CAMPEP_0172679410 /NCGR_PEP_ID=MMETSP1074-20121228/16045_1 /TAXON_ID=2916 /ORGANISM="Ceratium fusus, Strain PA161109" /LENGTH=151 /DNA_ID=CAMNT_0013497579 /DNA_START=104 /DNA_END=559 /DNA_ORIENTATION=+